MISGISSKNSPPCCWMLRNKGGIFTKYPRSQIPNFFLACGGLQKLVFCDFTFCSPTQAEIFAISRFRNTILPSKIDVLLPKYQNFRLPAEPLRQIPRCCETRGNFYEGGIFTRNTTDLGSALTRVHENPVFPRI